MLTIDEIYNLQRHIKQCFDQREYSEIEAAFAPLSNHDLHYALNVKFIFNNQVDGYGLLMQTLQEWIKECPQSYLPYLYMASYWQIIADTERGIQSMDIITELQHMRFSIASDQLHFWCLKTIELNPKCVAAYNILLEAAGRYGTPYWFDISRTDSVDYSCEDYNEVALDYLNSHHGYIPPTGTITLKLSPPTSEEENFFPLYWLRKIIELEPQHLPSRKLIIVFLGPNWYGDKKKSKINEFLKSDYCSALSKQQMKYFLEDIKSGHAILHIIGSPRSYLAKIKKDNNRIQKIINSASELSHEEAILKIFFFIDHYNSILDAISHEDKRMEKILAENIYQLLHRATTLDCSWVMFSRSNDTYLLLAKFMKDYQMEDTLGILNKLSAYTNLSNQTSPFEMLYAVFSTYFPIANVDKSQQRDEVIDRFLIKENNLDYDSFKSSVYLICKSGYAIPVRDALLDLANKHESIKALILLHELYNNNIPNLSTLMKISHDSNLAHRFLQPALDMKSKTAILIKSRNLEKDIELCSDGTRRTSLINERERLLKFNIELGDPTAQYDYACSLISSNDKNKIQDGLYIEAPKVLFQNQVRRDQLAYIAYLYAFCAYNGRGMDKNIYVMDFWINQAILLHVGHEYCQFLSIVRERSTGIIYNLRLKYGKKRVSPKMKTLIDTFTA